MLMRCLTLGLVFVLSGFMLGMRLAKLQIDEAPEWEARAAAQQLANVDIAPQRGNIYDSNMKLMAQSATVWTITASPEQMSKSKLKNNDGIDDAARIASRELAYILDMDEAALYEKLSNEESKYYKVKARIEKPMADAVREMCNKYGIIGIYFEEDTKRYYPYEELGSTVLGFVGADNDGLEGIERYYDEILAGVPGRTMHVRDAKGNEVAIGSDGITYPAEDGNSIVLTLDTEIQRITEKYLAQAVEEHNARERGFAIVMDVNTGAILAMAVWPSYNPNTPYEIVDPTMLAALEAVPEGTEEYYRLQGELRTLQWRNKALADTYEPGSVMKIITAAAALDSGRYTQDDCFLCGAYIMVDGWDEPMRCANKTNHGSPSLREALIESCNVAFIRMSAGMGASTWYDYIRAFGLTEPTGIDLPGEPSQASINNLIYAESRLGPVQLASCSFGQSNKYTAVQMITAVSAAVNGGNLMQPYIVQAEVDANGNIVKQYDPVVKRQVISPETSAQLCDILEELVADTPNGKNAYVAGYRVGGKSGTSQKLEIMAQTDREDAYISSFVGFAPADNPQIAVLVALDEPVDPKMGNYFGGRLAGPTVREILRESLGVLGVDASYGSEEELARKAINVPNGVGQEVSYAQRLLNEAGLTYKVMGGGADVIGQWPSAYSQIPYGGEVILYTDAGMKQEMVKVPDLVGRSPSAAKELARGLGLNVITTGAPDDGGGVVVISQSLEAETSVPRASVITLTIQDQTNITD